MRKSRCSNDKIIVKMDFACMQRGKVLNYKKTYWVWKYDFKGN